MSVTARQHADSPDDPCPETDYPTEIIETPEEGAGRRLPLWLTGLGLAGLTIAVAATLGPRLLSAPTPTPHRVTEAAPRADTSQPDLPGAGRTVYDSWVRPPTPAPRGTCAPAGR